MKPSCVDMHISLLGQNTPPCEPGPVSGRGRKSLFKVTDVEKIISRDYGGQPYDCLEEVQSLFLLLFFSLSFFFFFFFMLLVKSKESVICIHKLFLLPFHLKYMCNISRISPLWVRAGCKKTMCQLHHPHKRKFIHSFILKTSNFILPEFHLFCATLFVKHMTDHCIDAGTQSGTAS